MQVSPEQLQQQAAQQNLPGIDPGYVLFGKLRPIRAKWPNATMLAEELFAMMQTNTPFSIGGPIQIVNQTAATQAGRQFNLGDFNANMPPGISGRVDTLQLAQQGLSPWEAQQNQNDPGKHDPTINVFFGDGTQAEQRLTPDGVVTAPSSGGQNQPSISGTAVSVGGGGAVVTVTGGSGTSYTGTILGDTSTTINITALNVVAGESLTAGKSYIAVVVGSAYYIQPPVWD